MTKTKQITLLQAVLLVKKTDSLFDAAARAWTRGNNSGNSKANDRGLVMCAKYRRDAEALLTPLGIEVDYPGLYPSFKVNGFEHHTTLSAVSAALEQEAA